MTRASIAVVPVLLCVATAFAVPAYDDRNRAADVAAVWRVRQAPADPKEEPVAQYASGEFEVHLSPLKVENAPEGALLGRMSLDKTFFGDLEAVSHGQMLTAGTSVADSAGYVAIEQVTGTLNGRSGTFALQHTGTMNRGAPSLSVTVVPDSGTGELTGLTGTVVIRIEGGKHFYEMEYALPE